MNDVVSEDDFSPELDQEELELLYKVLDCEIRRWDKIRVVEEERSPRLELDYGYNYLHFSNLLDIFESNLQNAEPRKDFAFSILQTSIILYGVEQECALYEKSESTLNPYEFHILMEIRHKLKEEAIKLYGERVLNPIFGT